jgi:hypothetical protein
MNQSPWPCLDFLSYRRRKKEMELNSQKLITNITRLIFVTGMVVAALVLISHTSPTTKGQDAPTAATSHLGVAITDMVQLGPISVDPGDSVTALTVPAGRTFVLTDIVVFTDRAATAQGFYADYGVLENDQLKFRYRVPEGGNAGWSQNFTGGIVFATGSAVKVETASFRTAGRLYVQLLGYYL